MKHNTGGGWLTWNRQSGSNFLLMRKKLHLHLAQVKMIKGFLERNAISKEQYEKSFHELTDKMGIQQTTNMP